MKSELKKLADKNGIQIQLSSLNSYLKNAQIENEKIRMIFSRMFGVILIGTIIINLSMCALSFIVNKKQYGVLYICEYFFIRITGKMERISTSISISSTKIFII